MNYYNDNDSRSVAWIHELIKAELIPAGHVDDRSIADVTKCDLQGYTQCHFFAGIAGWSEALRLAGVAADVSLWTGSCPCQPFSQAGKREGEKDPRHLWPEFRRLIAECNPPIVFGEQVASKDGRLWLSGVRSDLEELGYAVGAADLCAASVGAPHIRQRLYWVSDTKCSKWRPKLQPNEQYWNNAGRDETPSRIGTCCEDGRMANTQSAKLSNEWPESNRLQNRLTNSCRMGNAVRWGSRTQSEILSQQEFNINRASESLNFWSNSIWLPCTDGKARRIEPEIFPLVDGIPGRVGLLRGSGNAIVPEVAAEFIKSYMETLM